MKTHLLRRGLLVIGCVAGLILLTAFFVPLLISAKPLDNLSTAKSVATDKSRFVTIPFDGTDGIEIHYLESDSDAEEGPVFLLLHGSLYNSFSWDKVIDHFGKKGTDNSIRPDSLWLE